MSYWNGTRWEDDLSTPASRPARFMSRRERRIRHAFGALTEGAMLGLIVVALISGTTLAGKGRGQGNQAIAGGGCTVDGTTVTGTGLPTDQVLNFMVTDDSGSDGWVLGWSDGTWAVSVPARSGPTTYEFASKTWGPSSAPKYEVFASCSAG